MPLSSSGHYLLLATIFFWPLSSSGQVPIDELTAKSSLGNRSANGVNTTSAALPRSSVRISTQEVTSLRTPLSISLGDVEPGAVQEFEIPLLNKLEVDLHPTDAERSCGCISGSLQSDTMKVGELFILSVTIKFPEKGGQHFRQQLKLFDKEPVVAPLVINFTAAVRETLVLEPRVLRVQSTDSPVDCDVILTSGSKHWDLTNATIVSTLPGVQVAVAERDNQRLKLVVSVDPTKAFRGRLTEAVPLVVQNVLRNGIESEYSLACPISFDRFVACAPSKIVFLPVDEKLVGKVLMIGRFIRDDIGGPAVSEPSPLPMKVTAT